MNMFFDTDIFLYGGLFVGVLLLVEGMFFLVQSVKAERAHDVNRRLRIIAETGDAKAALRKFRHQGQGDLDRLITTAFPGLACLLEQAGLVMPPSRFALLMAAAGFVTGMASAVMLTVPIAVDTLIGAVFGPSVSLLILMRKRHKRFRLCAEQLPDAIDLIVRALRAGHPTAAAMGLVASEMGDPIGTEFGLAVDEMTYGRDLHVALARMGERVSLQDLRFLITTVQIQYHSGGNLAEVLTNLSTVIRQRFRMFAKIKALTSEGRFSAIIVGVLPLAVGGIVNLLDPKFFGDVAQEPVFLPMVLAAIALVLAGWFVSWRMVNFKV